MARPARRGRVAVLGAGPAGIAVGKFLLDEGFDPVLFEAGDSPGGQWHADNPLSGVWHGMVTNTSREMTHFSDLDWPQGTPVFPLAERVWRYLNDYADEAGLSGRIRCNSPVTGLDRSDGTYQVRVAGRDDERFSRVVVATGRFNRPVAPSIPGVPDQGESGRGGSGPLRVMHSHDFLDAAEFEGARVLVAGGAISALEIASELVQAGASRVDCAMRRQRYVLRKVYHGVPTDHFNFNLSEALAGERLDAAELADEMKQFAIGTAGRPEDYGAAAPHPDAMQAGFTKCEDYLDLVAAGLIGTRTWPERADGRSLTFTGGSRDDYDVLILATGYALRMPFLSDSIARKLHVDAGQMALHRHTFHPAFPGLAFIGFYNQVGPYFPILELHARWIAYVFSGKCLPPSADEMEAGVKQCLESWKTPQKIPMHQLALLFAREIGALPDPADWPELSRSVLFGPLSPPLFRLSGPDALAGAPQRVRSAAAAFGMIADNDLRPDEARRLERLGIAAPCAA